MTAKLYPSPGTKPADKAAGKEKKSLRVLVEEMKDRAEKDLTAKVARGLYLVNVNDIVQEIVRKHVLRLLGIRGEPFDRFYLQTPGNSNEQSPLATEVSRQGRELAEKLAADLLPREVALSDIPKKAQDAIIAAYRDSFERRALELAREQGARDAYSKLSELLAGGKEPSELLDTIKLSVKDAAERIDGYYE